MSARHKAREAALQSLYAAAVGGADPQDSVRDVLARRRPSEDGAEYARRIVAGVAASRERLDERIAALLENWRFDRVSNVDRIILEMALFELLECPEVPTGVIIDEAIELAHRFSGEKAGIFVNGILDRLAREVRPA
ncbi:MAG: transcription antitermination factor NusB [Candidatus Krumholzibacteria bacterium]|nr:transcription antitermination factor NusB [Candidatus Krumholzibacteria bacterium]